MPQIAESGLQAESGKLDNHHEWFDGLSMSILRRWRVEELGECMHHRGRS